MSATMITLLVLAAALDAGAPPAPVVTPNRLRDAKLILADYARAIGDEKAWHKHKSIRVKREVVIKAMNFKTVEETHLVRSGKVVSVSSTPGMGLIRRGYDGRTAWGDDPIYGLRVLAGAEADELRIAATWNSEWHLGEVYAVLGAVAPPAGAPQDRALECVELGKRHGGPPTTTCFDAQTHLRVWEKGAQSSPGGDVPYVTRFSEWRVLDGVRVWRKEELTVGPVTMEGHIVEIVFDEPAPAQLFTLPKKK
jgi:hypothetical protein